MTHLFEVIAVGRFEVLRALRTWRAMALFLLYGIAYGGGAYLFVKILGQFENSIAKQMMVATTPYPGAMLDKLVQNENFRGMVGAMTGSEALLEELILTPPLAIFGMWFGLLLIPFFAASTSAECLSIDLANRSLRFEALRTGRMEILAGRFLGQLALTGIASMVAVSVTFAVGMLFMVHQTPLLLAGMLAVYTFRAWCFSIPFVGLGVATSALTLSAAWARVLALGGTAGSWIVYGVALAYAGDGTLGVLSDLTIQLLPQGWMQTLWNPGLGWLPGALVCACLGVSMVALGYARFATRDL